MSWGLTPATAVPSPGRVSPTATGVIVTGWGRGSAPAGGDPMFYALGGLRRIGPKAAPALPAVRALLDDKSPGVRKSAAEVVAAIGAGDGKGGPEVDDPPEDLRLVLNKAGFDEKVDWG